MTWERAIIVCSAAERKVSVTRSTCVKKVSMTDLSSCYNWCWEQHLKLFTKMQRIFTAHLFTQQAKIAPKGWCKKNTTQSKEWEWCKKKARVMLLLRCVFFRWKTSAVFMVVIISPAAVSSTHTHMLFLRWEKKKPLFDGTNILLFRQNALSHFFREVYLPPLIKLVSFSRGGEKWAENSTYRNNSVSKGKSAVYLFF